MLRILLFCVPVFGLSFSQIHEGSNPITSGSKIICPDGRKECPEDTTCCEMPSGYGCCPVPNAVCCSDKIHCCPEGYTCNESEGSCVKEAASKSNARSVYKGVKLDNKKNICPGGEAWCGPSATCCKTSGLLPPYLCCPVPNAVCCSDGLHCCREGQVCDMAAKKCIDRVPSLHTPLLKKQKPAKMTLRKRNHQNMAAMMSNEAMVICPDGEYACPEGQTCCKMPSGEWGCCPLADAVCCEDHIHCCPHGTTCNIAKGACDQAYRSVPWLKKTPAAAVVME